MTDQKDPPIFSEIFPVEDVRKCANDPKLQREGHSWTNPEIENEMVASKSGAIEAGAPESVKWIYFRSPDWTWEALCGREGWVLVDPDNLVAQFDFSMTVMN